MLSPASLAPKNAFYSTLLKLIFPLIFAFLVLGTTANYFLDHRSPPPLSSFTTSCLTNSSLPVDTPTCSPHLLPGHLFLDPINPQNTRYRTYSSSCPANPSPWIARALSAIESNTPIPELQNKEIVAIGDSVDRAVLVATCKFFGAEVQYSHISNASNLLAEGYVNGSPRVCTIPKLNLTLASYFMYGFDEDVLWPKHPAFIEPGKYTDRMKTFASWLKTLPSGGKPDVVMASVVLWELYRAEEILAQAGKPPPDPPVLADEYMEGYSMKLRKHLGTISKLLPKETQMIWRQSHQPNEKPTYFDPGDPKNPGGERARFHPVKVRMVNEAARAVVGQFDGERKMEGAVGMEMWNIGDAITPWHPSKWLGDKIHPKDDMAVWVWGEAWLDFLGTTKMRP